MKNTQKKSNKSDNFLHKAIWIGIPVLIIALICSIGINIHTTNKSRRFASNAESQQQRINQYEKSTQSADQAMQEQQKRINELEQKTASQEQLLKEKSRVLSDVTSRYNKLVQKKKNETSSKSKSPAPTKVAISDVSEKTCYLTFDDGPSNNTLKILDILKKFNVKATFFVMGSGNLSYVKRIHDEGHTVALHTYSHDYSDIYRSQKAFFNDLDRIKQAVQKQADVDPKITRFPGGSGNTVSVDYCKGIMTSLTKEVMDRGYVYFDWNVNSGDADVPLASVNAIMKNIKSQGGYNKQDVVLMHDTAAKTTTVTALPQIIEYYIDKGYTFAPLTVDTPQIKGKVRN
ncbi:MAG: polysaccharide deacetylase family protein [Clostridia bacterium]|nr:polysaccharide deacetylase family protein [Clostridia bacterium]